jgi:topoisomerase-4 subunit A
MVAALRGEKYELYPDFPTGGSIDVSDYNDGLGKVLVRAKFDTRDPKKIVVKELPFGSTTESLISSIESAARRNKVKIASINDYTTEEVEIEIKLARGVYSQDVVDALYAFTDCETSISVNPLVIEELKPVVKSVTEIIDYHAERLVSILKAELEIEQGNLRDRLHARTLEQIFVEERIYKDIEEMTTGEAVIQAVIDGFKPFASKIRRKVTEEDVERLLKIPIRRISLYDINKAKKEVRAIESRLKKIAHHLENLTDYAVSFLEGVKKNYGKQYGRLSEITSFERVDVREAAERNLELRYDSGTGYLGYGLKSGKVIIEVSPYDRVLVIRKSGVYSVIDVPEKLFVDKGMLACGHADKDILTKRVFSIIYRNNENKSVYLKRCKIEQFIIGKSYSIVPDNCTILKLTSKQDVAAELTYKPKPRLKVLEETFPVKEYLVKSVRATGVKLSDKEVRSAKFVTWKGKKKKK